jgi:ribosomal protein S18 acetylase RimI-like enzyme
MSAVDMATAHEERASVRPATSEEIPRMADVLARAFFDDPAFSWVLREDADRMRVLVRGFELLLRRVWLEQEHTYTTKSVAGVAAWELPDQWKLGVGRQLGLLPAMLRVFGRHSPRVLRAIAMLEASHPREPHHYLAFIGVDPDWQGRGLGGALLAAVLERCDRERMPAFLEASRARNRDLYERHGFAVTEEFRLGRGAPPQWRMWREPRGA